jgi:DNA-binding CsgD family transcriptional regulator
MCRACVERVYPTAKPWPMLESGITQVPSPEMEGTMTTLSTLSSTTLAQDYRIFVTLLTPREREVALLLAERWSDQEIADHLCISYRTVTTHVAHIFDKLGVSSRRSIRPIMASISISPNPVECRRDRDVFSPAPGVTRW